MAQTIFQKVVTVSFGMAGAVVEVLRNGGVEVMMSAPNSAMTETRIVVETDLSNAGVQDLVWVRFPDAYCSVRDPAEGEVAE